MIPSNPALKVGLPRLLTGILALIWFLKENGRSQATPGLSIQPQELTFFADALAQTSKQVEQTHYLRIPKFVHD